MRLKLHYLGGREGVVATERRLQIRNFRGGALFDVLGFDGPGGRRANER
jgi:hypothetical protein